MKLTGTVIMLYNDQERKKAEHVVHDMVKRAIQMEGTVTVSLLDSDFSSRVFLTCCVQGEHGVGLVKRDYLPHELGQTTIDAMRQVSPAQLRVKKLFSTHVLTIGQIKKAFDPLCLLNCDKVVRMQQPKAGEVSEW